MKSQFAVEEEGEDAVMQADVRMTRFFGVVFQKKQTTHFLLKTRGKTPWETNNSQEKREFL